MKKNPSVEARRSRSPLAFSLGSGVLLTTVVAVLIAAIHTGAVYHTEKETAELITVVGVVGLVMGAIMGLAIVFHRRGGFLGALLGAVAGMGFGAVGAILCVLPASLPVLAVGSLLLVGMAAVMRHFSSAGDDEPAADWLDIPPAGDLDPADGAAAGNSFHVEA